MFNLNESLVYYGNAISGNNAVLIRLRNYAEKSDFLPQILELIDDIIIIIENNQCFRQPAVYNTLPYFPGKIKFASNKIELHKTKNRKLP